MKVWLVIVLEVHSIYLLHDSLLTLYATFVSNIHFLQCLMQLNIAYPQTGCQKKVEIDDESKL